MSAIRRIPFTLVFLAVMVAANYAAGTFSGSLPLPSLASWGISHISVREGEIYRLVTGTFLSHDRAMLLRQLVFAAVVIGYYEWRQGSPRAVGMFFTIDVLGSLAVLFVIVPVLAGRPDFGGDAVLNIQDVGMSAGGFGLVGASLFLQKRRWLLVALVAAGIGAKILYDFEAIADSAHLVCLVLGFGFQARIGHRETTARGQGADHAEL